jgi:2-polyprenyl-3-methyl-5-hydroxy-6-metoxy-1,4-benzoquinol methylase
MIENHHGMCQIKCPVCFESDYTMLQSINMQLQHSLYCPENETIQKKLTQLVYDNASTNEYQMLKCNNCSLEFSNPMKSPGEDWYILAYNSLNLYPSERWEFQYLINKLQSKDTLAEIGCGSGAFLKKCQEWNIDAYGFDLSSQAVEECRRNGLYASVIDLELLNIPKKVQNLERNVFCSFHTLEHLERPERLFQIAHKFSTKSTTLWVSIPSNKRPTRFFGETEFLDLPPHHLTRWTPKSLELIARNNGWNLCKIIYEPINTKNRLWYYTTRMSIYKKNLENFKKNKHLERVFRYAFYPINYLFDFFNQKNISGFSMLAKFVKQ